MPGWRTSPRPAGPRGMAAKRGVDLVAGGTALIVLAPGLALIAAAIRVSMGRPVLYRQERPGLAGETFRIVKFRTMSQERDAGGRLLSDEGGITNLRRGPRETSLEEPAGPVKLGGGE